MIIGDAYQTMFECTKCRRRTVRHFFHRKKYVGLPVEVVCDCGNGMSPVMHAPCNTLLVWDEEQPLDE